MDYYHTYVWGAILFNKLWKCTFKSILEWKCIWVMFKITTHTFQMRREWMWISSISNENTFGNICNVLCICGYRMNTIDDYKCFIEYNLPVHSVNLVSVNPFYLIMSVMESNKLINVVKFFMVLFSSSFARSIAYTQPPIIINYCNSACMTGHN